MALNAVKSKVKFEDQPGFLTRVALQRATSIFAEVFRGENLTPSQHAALVASLSVSSCLGAV